jgi:hypothetical protein
MDYKVSRSLKVATVDELPFEFQLIATSNDCQFTDIEGLPDSVITQIKSARNKTVMCKDDGTGEAPVYVREINGVIRIYDLGVYKTLMNSLSVDYKYDNLYYELDEINKKLIANYDRRFKHPRTYLLKLIDHIECEFYLTTDYDLIQKSTYTFNMTIRDLINVLSMTTFEFSNSIVLPCIQFTSDSKTYNYITITGNGTSDSPYYIGPYKITDNDKNIIGLYNK